jgi:hypothetical protein
MEFKNDFSKLNNEMFDSVKYLIFDLFFSTFAMSSALYFRLEELEVENIGLVLALGFLFMTILVIIFLYKYYKNKKNSYLNFVLDIQENGITEKYSYKKVELNKECKILKYKNGNIVIKNGKNEIYISKYINNKIEFENLLSSINSVNVKNETFFSKIIGTFVFVFFIHLFFINISKGLEVYLFLEIGFVFTVIISTICSIIYKRKNVLNIIGIIFKIILIFIFSINILDVFIG